MTDTRYLPEGERIHTRENEAAVSSYQSLERAMTQGRILEGTVLRCESGTMALHVALGCAIGIIERDEAVYSHDDTPIRDIAILTRVGKPIAAKILSLERRGNRTIAHLSRRAAQRECMENFILPLRAGDIIPARVTHLEPFGAFVDIGCGIVSLLPVDAISVSRIAHPSDRLSPGDRLLTVVRSVEEVSGRVSVTHRELLGTWEENAAQFHAGQTVPGIVRSVEPYGIFVELTPNLAGLAEVRDGVQPGRGCAVFIKSINPERMKIKLVLIDAHADALVPPMHYFGAPAAGGHIDRFRYSPIVCPRTIETVFSPGEAAHGDSLRQPSL